jgi:YHS domain-containing protein
MNTKPKALRIFSQLFLVWVLLIANISMVSGQSPTPADFNVNREGVILEGYDLVSYFIGTVTKGKATFKYRHQGIEYWFANEENKQFFVKNPDKFIPAYGGWCAYAMAEDGEKVKIDPETYKIIEGELYLFYNFYFNNTLIKWNKNERNLQEKADKNWLKLISR